MFSLVVDDDDDDDDSEEDRDTPTYTAVSNTPTRITLTAKVSQKRKRGPNKIKIKDQNVIQVCSLHFSLCLSFVGLLCYMYVFKKINYPCINKMSRVLHNLGRRHSART